MALPLSHVPCSAPSLYTFFLSPPFEGAPLVLNLQSRPMSEKRPFSFFPTLCAKHPFVTYFLDSFIEATLPNRHRQSFFPCNP